MDLKSGGRRDDAEGSGRPSGYLTILYFPLEKKIMKRLKRKSSVLSNLLVWAVRGLLALCLQLCYPAARFQKEESVRRDPAYAVYETYRYAYERYGYLFSYAEETGGEGMVAAGNPSWQGEDGNAGAADREQESTGADGLKTEQTGAGSALSASSLAASPGLRLSYKAVFQRACLHYGGPQPHEGGEASWN